MMDTSMLAFPKPKDKKKIKNDTKCTKNEKKSQKDDKSYSKKKEFCIMPKNSLYEIERKEGLVRHEVFFGRKNRQLSIKYGLIIFLNAEKHNMSNKGIHFNQKFCEEVQKVGQKAFMKYYNKTEEEFRQIFGKNYL